MFAKSAVFFFALAAFVTAAPVVDYRPWNPIELGPGPVKIQPVADATSKRASTLDLSTDLDFGILLKRALVDVDVDLNDGVTVTLPGLKRGDIDLDTFVNQLANALGSDALNINPQGQDQVSNDAGYNLSGSK